VIGLNIWFFASLYYDHQAAIEKEKQEAKEAERKALEREQYYRVNYPTDDEYRAKLEQWKNRKLEKKVRDAFDN
jgi:hypothetical protein